MAWWTYVEAILGGGAVLWGIVFGLSGHLGDRLLEQMKAQHSKDLADIQNAFSIGATSHMAAVLFDKHIGFCEEYKDAMSRVLPALIEGGVEQAPPDVTELSKIRQKWALWLTDDIEGKLDQFEKRMLRIPEAPVLDAYGAEVPKQKWAETVIADLRRVLLTKELTDLRSDLIARSSGKLSPRH